MPAGKRERLLHFYEDMLRIRFFEEKVRDVLLPRKLFRGSSHLSIGQESVAVGVCDMLEKKDAVSGTYRGHATYLAKGGSLKGMIAEMYGKDTGCARGKGGSMHMFSREKNFFGGHGIVGAQVSLGNGLGRAAIALQAHAAQALGLSTWCA